jgi:hypothetical protein
MAEQAPVPEAWIDKGSVYLNYQVGSNSKGLACYLLEVNDRGIVVKEANVTDPLTTFYPWTSVASINAHSVTEKSR